jgi:hypothetical protein
MAYRTGFCRIFSLLFAVFVLWLWYFAPPCVAQERWWQREVPAPSTHQVINQNYMSKRRELEQAWDQLQRDAQAQRHFQGLGQKTPSINAAISGSRNKVNRLEYELSQIPMYVTRTPVSGTQSESRPSPTLQESWRDGWAPEPFAQSPRRAIEYTPMDYSHSSSSSPEAKPNRGGSGNGIQIPELLHLVRENGFTVDTVTDSLFIITDKKSFRLLLRTSFPGEFRFLKKLVLATTVEQNMMLKHVNELNSAYPSLRSHIAFDSNVSQHVLHIEARIPATISDFGKALQGEIGTLRKAYVETQTFEIEDQTYR